MFFKLLVSNSKLQKKIKNYELHLTFDYIKRKKIAAFFIFQIIKIFNISNHCVYPINQIRSIYLHYFPQFLFQISTKSIKIVVNFSFTNHLKFQIEFRKIIALSMRSTHMSIFGLFTLNKYEKNINLCFSNKKFEKSKHVENLNRLKCQQFNRFTYNTFLIFLTILSIRFRVFFFNFAQNFVEETGKIEHFWKSWR
jgi:hypothetical protein